MLFFRLLLLLLFTVREVCLCGVYVAFGHLLALVYFPAHYFGSSPLGKELLLVVEGVFLVGLDFMRTS